MLDAAWVHRTLAELRALANGRMVDTCTVKREIDRSDQDEDTGAEAPIYEVLFTSPCRLAAGQTPVVLDIGGRQVAVPQPELHLPINDTTGVVREDDIADLSEDSAPEVAGRTLRIVSVPVQAQATALRLPVREDPPADPEEE